MKQTLALVLMVFGSFGAFAVELKKPLEIRGEMKCKVKDQIILETEDGKSKRYSGKKDSFNTGDTLFLTYKYAEYFNVPSYILNFNLKDKLRDETVIFISENMNHSSPFYTVSFSSDSILLKRPFGQSFSLQRYYKNDWEGMYSNVSNAEMNSHIALVDCRNQEGTLEEIMEAYKNRPQINNTETNEPT